MVRSDDLSSVYDGRSKDVCPTHKTTRKSDSTTNKSNKRKKVHEKHKSDSSGSNNKKRKNSSKKKKDLDLISSSSESSSVDDKWFLNQDDEDFGDEYDEYEDEEEENGVDIMMGKILNEKATKNLAQAKAFAQKCKKEMQARGRLVQKNMNRANTRTDKVMDGLKQLGIESEQRLQALVNGLKRIQSEKAMVQAELQAEKTELDETYGRVQEMKTKLMEFGNELKALEETIANKEETIQDYFKQAQNLMGRREIDLMDTILCKSD